METSAFNIESDELANSLEESNDFDLLPDKEETPAPLLTDIMIDLETLGTNPDAAIISIAAVAFDLRTGQTDDDTFFVNIDISSNLAEGRKVDPQTLSWWVDDNSVVFSKWCESKKDPLTIALMNFQIWLSRKIGDARSYQIWGNSNRFDLGILADAYEHDLPWHFRSERDVRTLVMFDTWGFKGKTREEFAKIGEDLHNALTDCRYQIEYCHRIYNEIKPKLSTAIGKNANPK